MQSLGVLEVKGLALAIASCDAMLKSANVKFIGHEYAKGGGWCSIKIEGDVASIKAALDAGEALASQYNGLVSQTVIARPAENTATLVAQAHKSLDKKSAD